MLFRSIVDTGYTLSGAVDSGITLIFSGGSAASDLTLPVNGDTVDVTDGSVLTGVSGHGNLINVSAGGSDVNVQLTVGTETVYAGGTASGTFINGGGQQDISGGIASGAVVDGSEQNIYTGSAIGTILDDSIQGVSGTAISTTVDGDSTQYVHTGGFASATTLSGGAEFVESGGGVSGTIIGSGGYELIETGAVDSGGAVINSSGQQVVEGVASGTIISSGGLQYVEQAGSAISTTIDNGGDQYVYSGGIVSGEVINSGGTLEVVSGASASDVQIGYGGAVDLESFSFNAGETATVTDGELVFSSGGRSYEVADVSGSYTDRSFSVTSGIGDTALITEAICYLRGTRILTPTGERPIEDVEIGDAVVTRFSGIQPVKWIGRQIYAAAEVRGNRERIPVHLRAGCLGQNFPARDLYVSPGHSMLVDGTLVLAKSLVNGITITQDWVPESADYFQIELDHHDCVVAEGTWSETFADGDGLRDRFHNVSEFYTLFPDHRPPEELVPLCAPRPLRGPALGAALRPVVQRASARLSKGPLHGFIDMVGEWKVEGWAQDRSHPKLPILLEVLVQDKVIGTVLACDFRPDLLEAVGHGDLSFSFASPVKLRPELKATLQVRRAGDGAALTLNTRTRESQINVSILKPVQVSRSEGERVRVAVIR